MIQLFNNYFSRIYKLPRYNPKYLSIKLFLLILSSCKVTIKYLPFANSYPPVGHAVVVVVGVCVCLLVAVLAVGVVRLRSAHRRAGDDEVEMAWDDTALTITVNPLEVSRDQSRIRSSNQTKQSRIPARAFVDAKHKHWGEDQNTLT